MINNLRKRIIEVAYRDGMGHIPSALSILDIVWTLYDRVMTKDDLFILSKGHGCMALYAVLEAKGLLSWDSKLWGHPKRGGAILASTGSLGHGMPMAVGLALAKKIRKEPGRVFVLVGDGECNEGTTWESALLAAHHKLGNLTVIVDQNHSGDRALGMGSLSRKFASFDWSTYSATGHDCGDIESSLSINSNGPLCVVFDTEKGHGVDFMVGDPSWHNRKLTKEDYELAIKSI